MGRFLRRLIGLAILVGGAWALWRWWNGTDGPPTFSGDAVPAPGDPVFIVAETGPAEPSSRPTAGTDSQWVDPDDGACPVSHPVKAKLASGIFHVPGGLSYERTLADRCYPDAEAAEGDGLRAAKR